VFPSLAVARDTRETPAGLNGLEIKGAVIAVCSVATPRRMRHRAAAREFRHVEGHQCEASSPENPSGPAGTAGVFTSAAN
jgi:hypothetical protein